MRPPFLRPYVCRALLIVSLLSLFALPPAAFAKGKDELTDNIKGLIGDFHLQVRDIQGNLKADLGEVPKTTPEANFGNVIQSIGSIGYDAWYQHKTAYYGTLGQFHSLVQNFGLDPLAGSQLRGVGGAADGFTEDLLWNEPTSFSKSLAMTLRRIRLNVERYDMYKDSYFRIPVIMSVQVFPSTEDKLLYTSSYGGGHSYTPKLNIAGIVGGTYAGPGDTEGNTTACVFGITAPSGSVDVTADGLGGPFFGSGTADSFGKWNVCLNIKYGNYKFEADDGGRPERREQGFQFLPPKEKF
jgi:hypothetical protein